MKTLEVPKSIKTTVYTEFFTRRRQEPEEGWKSTRQIKKVCQDNTQSCLHGKDESKTKYSASQVTLITWTNHPKNKQGIQAKKTSTKKSSFKKKYNVILQGASIKVNYIKRHHQEKR